MRLFAMLAAVCALSSPAAAQTPNCSATPDVDGRLACSDSPADKPAAAKRAAPTPARDPVAKAEPGTYIDEISAEDARMKAQLKNICRGC